MALSYICARPNLIYPFITPFGKRRRGKRNKTPVSQPDILPAAALHSGSIEQPGTPPVWTSAATSEKKQKE